jgi:hypothetical protein
MCKILQILNEEQIAKIYKFWVSNKLQDYTSSKFGKKFKILPILNEEQSERLYQFWMRNK